MSQKEKILTGPLREDVQVRTVQGAKMLATLKIKFRLRQVKTMQNLLQI